MVKIRRYINS